MKQLDSYFNAISALMLHRSERLVYPQTDVSANKMLRSARMAACRSRRSISALFFSGKWHIVLLNAQETAGIVLGLSALE
jgi:hypothetical protein